MVNPLSNNVPLKLCELVTPVFGFNNNRAPADGALAGVFAAQRQCRVGRNNIVRGRSRLSEIQNESAVLDQGRSRVAVGTGQYDRAQVQFGQSAIGPVVTDGAAVGQA